MSAAAQSHDDLVDRVPTDTRRLLATAAFIAAVLFGLAGVIGAIGYVIAVSRQR